MPCKEGKSDLPMDPTPLLAARGLIFRETVETDRSMAPVDPITHLVAQGSESRERTEKDRSILTLECATTVGQDKKGKSVSFSKNNQLRFFKKKKKERSAQ